MIARLNPIPIPDGRSVHILEEVTRTAPLGIRFADAVLSAPVRGGLVVRARHRDGGPWTRARESSSGVHGFVTLPTTRTAERRPVAEFGAAEPYIVEVVDLRGRFLPMRVEASAPVALAGGTVLLFPSPDRPVPPGFTAVRATLRYEDADVPAASGRRVRPSRHAFATLTLDGVAHDGIADGGGELVVVVPLAEVEAGIPLSAQTAEGVLRVRFDPGLAPDPTPLPLLEDIVDQPVVPVVGAATALDLPVALDYHDDVILRSPGRSELLLQPK
jgi:hypothetical protein